MMDKGSLDVNAVEFNTSAVVMNRSMADLNINNGLHETRAGPSPIMVSAHDMGSTGDMGIPGYVSLLFSCLLFIILSFINTEFNTQHHPTLRPHLK